MNVSIPVPHLPSSHQYQTLRRLAVLFEHYVLTSIVSTSGYKDYVIGDCGLTKLLESVKLQLSLWIHDAGGKFCYDQWLPGFLFFSIIILSLSHLLICTISVTIQFLFTVFFLISIVD